MIILGIDPGINITGFAAVEIADSRCFIKDRGYLRPPRSQSFSRRLCFLYDNFLMVLEKLLPDIVVVEKIYSHISHPYTSVLMGHARGVLFLAIEKMGCRVESFSASKIKKAIVGRGNASKEQVRAVLKQIYRLSDEIDTLPLDVSDALALATGFIFYKLRGCRGQKNETMVK